jgi:hypothetical protein
MASSGINLALALDKLNKGKDVAKAPKEKEPVKP